MTIDFRRSGPEDHQQICSFWKEHWGADFMVVHGEIYRPENLEGFIAADHERWMGLITYSLRGNECEIVSLDSLQEGRGIGSRLIENVVSEARRAGCRRAFLITTNDNLEALGFYQKRGFELVMIHRGAVQKARKLKPGISLVGEHGIPLRDEIELEMVLLQDSA